MNHVLSYAATPASVRRRRRLALGLGALSILAVGVLAVYLWWVNPWWGEIDLDLNSPLPKYDAYLTWQNYYGEGEPDETVVFIWNGTILGCGRQGLRRVFESLRQMPLGSRILVYPRYHMEWEVSEPPRFDPWLNWGGEYLEILRSRKLTVLHSPRDHRGIICPECVNPYEKKGPAATHRAE
jgi:hypothetical protein